MEVPELVHDVDGLRVGAEARRVDGPQPVVVGAPPRQLVEQGLLFRRAEQVARHQALEPLHAVRVDPQAQPQPEDGLVGAVALVVHAPEQRAAARPQVDGLAAARAAVEEECRVGERIRARDEAAAAAAGGGAGGGGGGGGEGQEQQQRRVSAVFGIGGGSACDHAKFVVEYVNQHYRMEHEKMQKSSSSAAAASSTAAVQPPVVPLVLVPTILSVDAPYTRAAGVRETGKVRCAYSRAQVTLFQSRAKSPFLLLFFFLFFFFFFLFAQIMPPPFLSLCPQRSRFFLRERRRWQRPTVP